MWLCDRGAGTDIEGSRERLTPMIWRRLEKSVLIRLMKLKRGCKKYSISRADICIIGIGRFSFDVDYLEGTLDGKLFWAQPLNTGGYRVIWDADDSDGKQNRLCSGSRILLHQRHSGCIQIRFLKFYLYYPYSVWYYHIYNQ